ncbi:MAG TPA: S9 family peptidase [Ignavibacteriaceae bacterium]|nr:S9 family peptidase [Ignavibacteriaceae bacterium]
MSFKNNKSVFKILALAFIFFIRLSNPAFPQEKNLSLKELIIDSKRFKPETAVQLQWIAETNFYSYSLNDTLFIRSAGNNYSKKIPLTQINNVLNENKMNSLSAFPEITWIDQNSFKFWDGSLLLKFESDKSRIIELNEIKDNGSNVDLSSQNNAAYTIDNNLFIAVNRELVQITNDENKGIVNGQAVHRNEFGIKKGTFWSPQGNFLAFYRMDETMVTDYPFVDISFRPAKEKPGKYPMAGMTSHQVTVGIFDVNTKKTVWLKTGEPKDQYLTNVTWSPDEKSVYIAHLNRDQNHLRLIQYDTATGDQIKILFEEENEKYVEPEHGPIFFEKDPKKFIWFSERDGWNHLYLYESSGKLIKQLTKGMWEVTGFLGFDKDEKNIFFTSTQESPIERHFYKLNLNSLKIEKISGQAGTHSVLPNCSGNYFLDEFNSTAVPYQAMLLNESGREKIIFSSENPLHEYKIGKTKIFTLKNGGYDLYCRIILPADFDSTKKYPVLVYVYGGPHDQLVTDTWLGGAGLWLNYMAENGYIIFTMDNRGSAFRGLEFEQTTFRNLGHFEIEDQKLGAKYLKTLSYVDSLRLGVFGWSYGGFMTTSLMTRTPGLFKAAVSGGTVTDWSYYEVMYTERYMDTPESNPEGYKESSLLNYVKDLKGKLLMVHVMGDPVVLWQNSLLFLKKAVELGIQLDYFPYPGEAHGVTGKDNYHLYKKITDYFEENLKKE